MRCFGMGVLCAVALSVYAAPFQERQVVAPRGAWRMGREAAIALPGKTVSSADFDASAWLTANVPCTVLSTLVDHKVLPDPYFGLNNQKEKNLIPDLSNGNRDYYTAWFRTPFTLPDTFKGKTVWMRPEGINYRSEIWLNGSLVAVTAGMFARTPVDVTRFVKPGANVMAVKVFPVDHPGDTKPKRWGAPNGEWHNGGDGEIGRNVTMLMSAGWDFTFSDGVRDRNTGIWRDITFYATGDIRLDAPFVKTKLAKDFKQAELEIEVELNNASLGGRDGELAVAIDGTDIKLSRKVRLFRGERRVETFKATLPNPKLWWPRNKGPQNLYTASFTVNSGKNGLSDRIQTRFGVREVWSDQGGPGKARQFYVNGRKIFIRGTNWIPEAMLRTDDARMAVEVRLSAESGLNLLRLWGGGIVESDYFYQLCDEYGLLVWQEFWMTGDTRHPDDAGLYLQNVADSVKRIRMHPSLCHYVASNESTETAGTRELLMALDGTRSYQMQSECDGVHDGSPYVPVNPMRYYEDTASDRGSRVYGFNPEYGTCALPPAVILREFMDEKDLWPINKEAWRYREGGGFYGITSIHDAFVNEYGPSRSIDEYARKSQAVDALAHRGIWEVWNRARNRATGVLFWYNNSPLPQVAGHAWDWSLEPTASYFAQKNALEPLHAQFDYLSNTVSVASDIYTPTNLTVVAEVFDFNSKRIFSKKAPVAVPAETCVDCFTIPFPETVTPVHFIRLSLQDAGGEFASTFYWRSTSRYEGKKTVTGPCVAGFQSLESLPKSALALAVASGNGKLRATVENTGKNIAFMTRVQLLDEAKKPLRPTIYSDNDFCLMPGEKRTVEIEPPAGKRYTVQAKAWNTDVAR
ncbi:MAG: glycoside hydrolase family 2 [Kiritimatiellae bacterium]|nr:glycoside hydrolase family 2 [Kiritimatiellia bacterium]